jgi:hypothetical protein
VDAIPDYTLNLQIGSDSFRFCIIDGHENKCLWLEDYRFSSLFFTEQLLDQLNLIYDDHQVLQAGFWEKIKLSFRNQHFTLIPEAFFKKELVNEYLQKTIETSSEPEEAFFYRHSLFGMVNVFSAERKIMDWFRAAYLNKTISILHQTSAFIEGVLQVPEKSTSAQSLSILVEQSHLTIVVTEAKKLHYCNTFFYSSVQDFTYYVMLVINELSMDPETCKVILYGELNHDSAIFSLLYKYIRYINFGSKPDKIQFSYRFDEILDHRYFDVYTLHFC